MAQVLEFTCLDFLQGVSTLPFLILLCFIEVMGLLVSLNVIILCLSVNLKNIISANSVLHLLVLFSAQMFTPICKDWMYTYNCIMDCLLSYCASRSPTHKLKLS
jgi:hypothetical protein